MVVFVRREWGGALHWCGGSTALGVGGGGMGELVGGEVAGRWCVDAPIVLDHLDGEVVHLAS